MTALSSTTSKENQIEENYENEHRNIVMEKKQSHI